MAEKDKYTRGKSGYSVADEKAAKAYGRQDYKESEGSGMKAAEAKYRAEVGGPNKYLHNTKSEKGRETNKKNVEFMSDAKIAARRKEEGRPPMSKKW